MLDWILRHTGGLLDWLLVFLFVAGLVFGCQLLINLLKDPEQGADGDQEE